MTLWLMVALAVAPPPPSLAQQVRARLVDASVQRGTFEQRKHIKGFKRPLLSNGTYVVTKGQGVQWNTLKPFAAELTVSASDITSRQGGVEVFKLDAKTEPTVRVITQLLFSLLAGDLEALTSQFDATGEVGPVEWTVELKPRAEGLKKVFTTITLLGSTAVHSVLMVEGNGDRTELTLTPQP